MWNVPPFELHDVIPSDLSCKGVVTYGLPLIFGVLPVHPPVWYPCFCWIAALLIRLCLCQPKRDLQGWESKHDHSRFCRQGCCTPNGQRNWHKWAQVFHLVLLSITSCFLVDFSRPAMRFQPVSRNSAEPPHAVAHCLLRFSMTFLFSIPAVLLKCFTCRSDCSKWTTQTQWFIYSAYQQLCVSMCHSDTCIEFLLHLRLWSHDFRSWIAVMFLSSMPTVLKARKEGSLGSVNPLPYVRQTYRNFSAGIYRSARIEGSLHARHTPSRANRCEDCDYFFSLLKRHIAAPWLFQGKRCVHHTLKRITCGNLLPDACASRAKVEHAARADVFIGVIVWRMVVV